MAKNCPSCQFPVDDEATACPNCPASWETDEDAEYRRRHAPQFGWRRYIGLLQLTILASLTLFAAYVALRLIIKADGPERQNPVVASVMPGSSLQQLAGISPSGVLPPPSAQPEAPGEEKDASGIVMISHEQQAPAVRHWRFRGRVLDLTSLAPIKRCSLEFGDPTTGSHFQTATDGAGRYRVELPSLEGHGYSVKINAGGYAPSYLDGATENVAALSSGERARMAKDLGHSLRTPSAVEAQSEKPVTTDFYLALEQ